MEGDFAALVTKACRLGRHFCLTTTKGKAVAGGGESQKPVGLAGFSVNDVSAR